MRVLLLAAIAALWTSVAQAECGRITWYGTESGNRTANGEHFDGSSMTCAHRSIAFNTRLTVTYDDRSIICRVNDRGPAKWTGNDLDLAKAAAQKLGIINAGRVHGCWEAT